LSGPRVRAKGAIQAYMASLPDSPKMLNVGLSDPDAFDRK
jgi:hypothetical protein